MANYVGTSGADTLIGTLSADALKGIGGNDTLSGRAGNDLLDGGTGDDVIDGGAGRDTIYGGDGIDWLAGGRGNDILSGGAGNDVFVFASGDRQDVITDFAVGDLIKISGYASAQSVAQVGTSVVVTLSTYDTITFSSATLASVKAALQFAGTTSGGGGATGITITGTNGWDTLNGTAGNDVIYGLGGYDVIKAGDGNDRIYGGLGGDGLYGGAGGDVFVYTTAAEGPQYGLMYYEWDIIHDFQSIDRIDLSAIDANALLSGNQVFHFAGYSNFLQPLPTHNAGDLYIRSDTQYADIVGFTNNDDQPDFYVEILLGGGQVAPAIANLIF